MEAVIVSEVEEALNNFVLLTQLSGCTVRCNLGFEESLYSIQLQIPHNSQALLYWLLNLMACRAVLSTPIVPKVIFMQGK